MSGPSVHISLARDLLRFRVPPPDSPVLPLRDDAWASPFAIDTSTYNKWLEPRVPVTIALIYAITTTVVNAVNRRRKQRPWPISRTRIFYIFVLLHNIALAVYSAITCAAMIRAMRVSWPGLRGEHPFIEAIDALCKINGPRGLGDAITYDTATSSWTVKNKLIHLGEDNLPDPTDVGRLWNEGLAFWGWWFYISKFYEVLDTFIILAKGKRSPTLQKYHHAGAMLCMWAGIRYMSPPIWMFVLVNSGIHTLMYTYYTLIHLGYRVPQRIKRTLTTMQITQFLVGASFAAAHLFISYDVPVTIPYTITRYISEAVSEAAAVVSSVAAAPIATAKVVGVTNWLKKIALRAAGEEGLAENIIGDEGRPFGAEYGDSPLANVTPEPRKIEEIRYRSEWQTVHCIDTEGQAFAIWLNCFYLMPLTLLFIRFFVRSYSQRRRASIDAAGKRAQSPAVQATKDAAHGVEHHFGKSIEKGVDALVSKISGADTAGERMTEGGNGKGQNTASTGSPRKKGQKDTGKQQLTSSGEIRRDVKEAMDEAMNKGSSMATKVQQKIQEVTEPSRVKLEEKSKEAQDSFDKKADEATAGMESVVGEVKDRAEGAKEGVKEVKAETKERAGSTRNGVKERAGETKKDVKGKAEDTKNRAQGKAKGAAEETKEEVERREEEEPETKGNPEGDTILTKDEKEQLGSDVA